MKEYLSVKPEDVQIGDRIGTFNPAGGFRGYGLRAAGEFQPRSSTIPVNDGDTYVVKHGETVCVERLA